jgi:hypothetical protein
MVKTAVPVTETSLSAKIVRSISLSFYLAVRSPEHTKRRQPHCNLLQRVEGNLRETMIGHNVSRTRQFDDIREEKGFKKSGNRVEPLAKRMRNMNDTRNRMSPQAQKEHLVSKTTSGLCKFPGNQKLFWRGIIPNYFDSFISPTLIALRAAILSDYSAANVSSSSSQGGIEASSRPFFHHGKQEQDPNLLSLASLFGAFHQGYNQVTPVFGGLQVPVERYNFQRTGDSSNRVFPSQLTSSGFSNASTSIFNAGPFPDYSLARTVLTPQASFFHSLEARIHATRATPLEILRLSLYGQPGNMPSAYMSRFPPPNLATSATLEKSPFLDEREHVNTELQDHQNTVGEWQAPTKLPAVLAIPDDRLKLTRHQFLLRHQIEAFEATDDDVTTHTRGRNKPITLGQVGIRCRHCAHLPVAKRQKGSVYFPATLLGLYQASQNMSATHMQCGLCNEMPFTIKHTFAMLMSTKSSCSGTGKHYWAQTAKTIGLVDTEEGIRFERKDRTDVEPLTVARQEGAAEGS